MKKHSQKREDASSSTNPYAGRWVARISDQVVGQGGTPEQALQSAKAARPKESPEIVFVPTNSPLSIPPIIERIRSFIPEEKDIYLVGGAVRDLLLNKPTKDFDFTLSGPAIPFARDLANKLQAAFYPLDEKRDAGRILLISEDDQRLTLDFTAQRGENLEADLKARDFTINAMALDLRQPQALLDPMNGAADLLAKRLRACTADALKNDPIRVMRGVRMAATFQLKIEEETRAWMREASNQIDKVSAERLRDELFWLLLAPKAATSLRALEILGALFRVLPELKKTKNCILPTSQNHDVWEHSLHVLDSLASVFSYLDEEYPSEGAGDLYSGLIVLSLGRYRKQISAHLQRELVVGRPLRALLFFAALYLGVGKPASASGEGDNVRFEGHEERGAQMTMTRGERLRLGRAEIERLGLIVAKQDLPTQLSKEKSSPDRRAIYRFFRSTGEAGVDICLISLASLMGSYGSTLTKEKLIKHLDTLRALLEGYWERGEEVVSPPAIINGDELMAALSQEPGEMIGKILDALQEEQAAGEISNKNEALAFAKDLVNKGA